MKKITILLLHLGYGGIEKTVASLCTMLADDYDIELIVTYKLADKPAFFIPKQVHIKYLMTDLQPNKQAFLKQLKQLHIIKCFKEGLKSLKILYLKKQLMVEEIKKITSDVIITTRSIHNAWVGKYAQKDILKIAWEHNYPDKKYGQKIVKSVENSDYLVVVSNELKKYYKSKLKQCKCLFIPNAIDSMPASLAKLDNKNLIAIGRLEVEKGFIDLIRLFKLVTLKEPTAHLDIIGDGSLKKAIQTEIEKFNLENNVTLHGFQNKNYINNCLSKASLYVMTSYKESFGIVLLEAMSHGIPCLAYTSARGAVELISNNVNGYLIKNRDSDKMAHKIIELLNDKEKREALGLKAYNKASAYTLDNVKKEWVKLLNDK